MYCTYLAWTIHIWDSVEMIIEVDEYTHTRLTDNLNKIDTVHSNVWEQVQSAYVTTVKVAVYAILFVYSFFENT